MNPGAESAPPTPSAQPAPPVPTASALPTPAQLRQLLQALGHGLLERETAVHLALLAALAGEHVLLVGPPGTAKSALARRLHAAFEGARWFERLLTRFSTPEELFGPLSLKALEDDRYERLVDGFLPTAGIAFLDEVFKANSAILNALLTLLNEREFDNGTARLRTPLVAVIAASNEVPSDDALQAFYDRFLVRVPVAPVGDAGFAALLTLDENSPRPAPQRLSAEARHAIGQAAAALPLGADFLAGCQALRARLAAHHTPLSDRRWRQFMGLVQTAAACEGRAEVDALDLWLAPYVASAKPEDVAPLWAWFIHDVAQAAPQPATGLLRAVQAFEQQLGIEQNLQDSADHNDGQAGKLAVARAVGNSDSVGPGSEGEHDGGPAMLRISSERLRLSLLHRWSHCHINARVAQVREIENQVLQALQQVQSQHAHLQDRLATRLWMPATLRTALLQGPEQTLATLHDLAERLAHTAQGFAALPCDNNLPDSSPTPVAWAAA